MTDDLQDSSSPGDVLAGFSDAELRALAARARETNDEALRRLVAGYIALRTLASETVTFLEAREGAITILRTPLFQRLRDATRRRPT